MSFIFIVSIFFSPPGLATLLETRLFLPLSKVLPVPPSILQEQPHTPFNATVITCDDQSSCCSYVCGSTLGKTLNVTVLHVADRVKKENCWPLMTLKGEAVRGGSVSPWGGAAPAVQAHYRRMYSLVCSVFGSCRILYEWACVCERVCCVCLARRCNPLQSETVPVWASEPALNLYTVYTDQEMHARGSSPSHDWTIQGHQDRDMEIYP